MPLRFGPLSSSPLSSPCRIRSWLRERARFLPTGTGDACKSPEETVFHRSVMLRDVLGRTRTTLAHTTSTGSCGSHPRPPTWKPSSGTLGKICRDRGQALAIIRPERGMSSRSGSSGHIDCVPGICTHRPSLCSIGCRTEDLRGCDSPRARVCVACSFKKGSGWPNLSYVSQLESVKVVTRLS